MISSHDARTVPSPTHKVPANPASGNLTQQLLRSTLETKRYAILQFDYKDKRGSDELYLSTHTICNIVINDKVYSTVEHYYQSQKFKPNDQKRFQGTNPPIKTAKEAKAAGSRGAMRRLFGYGISSLKWKGPSTDYDEDYCNIRALKRALWARWNQDPRFRKILMVPGRLFEQREKTRSTSLTVPEMGCSRDAAGNQIGLNIIGNLYNELACFHDLENYFEMDVKGKRVLNWTGSVPSTGTFYFYPYPRNTFGTLRQDTLHGASYKKCGYMVRDGDVAHPYTKLGDILTST